MRPTILISLLFLVAASSMMAGTIGNPLIPRTWADNCLGCLFLLGAQIPDGETVTDWSIYANRSGNEITPFLMDMITGEITGIGATQIGQVGVQAFSFDPILGSAVAGSDTMFGWRDGGTAAADANNGSIAYGGSGTAAMNVVWLSQDLTLGATLTDQSSGYGRYYSIEVDSSETPEPHTCILVGAGMLGLLTLRRNHGQLATILSTAVEGD